MLRCAWMESSTGDPRMPTMRYTTNGIARINTLPFLVSNANSRMVPSISTAKDDLLFMLGRDDWHRHGSQNLVDHRILDRFRSPQAGPQDDPVAESRGRK